MSMKCPQMLLRLERVNTGRAGVPGPLHCDKFPGSKLQWIRAGHRLAEREGTVG
jgi:hypothetical protein